MCNKLKTVYCAVQLHVVDCSRGYSMFIFEIFQG